MAELPELTILQRQMDESLRGRRIAAVELLQEKCLNLPVAEVVALLEGRRITAVSRKGKWLYLHLAPEHYLLLNLGMGADLWHYAPGAPLPKKYQFRLHLDDGSGLTCRFWWFGYIHLVPAQDLPSHRETTKLGPSPLEISATDLIAIARRYPRSPVKALILDQDKLSGIGNAYAHDVLWSARLHPQRKLGSIPDTDLEVLHTVIRQVMERATQMGGLEADFYHQGGHWDDFSPLFFVGYKAGQPCPRCGTPIHKLKTGATHTYLCPACQTA